MLTENVIYDRLPNRIEVFKYGDSSKCRIDMPINIEEITFDIEDESVTNYKADVYSITESYYDGIENDLDSNYDYWLNKAMTPTSSTKKLMKKSLPLRLMSINTLLASNQSGESSNTYPVEWDDEVGDIYGGYVDLVNGLLVQTHRKLIINGSNLVQSKITIIDRSTTYNSISFTISDQFENYSPKLSENIQACKFDYIKTVLSTNPAGNIWSGFIVGPYYIRIIGDLSVMPDKAGILSYLTNHPLTVIYELATPIVYRLTEQQIKAIKGQNRFYSDANTITTVRYWTHK